MAIAPPVSPTRTPTLGDVLPDGIPTHRVLLHPTPGTATVADVEAIHRREDRLCELIDGRRRWGIKSPCWRPGSSTS